MDALPLVKASNALNKLKPVLTPTLLDLSQQLLGLLDADGSAPMDAILAKLFPLAETRAASTQFSKLCAGLKKAAIQQGLTLDTRITGSKTAGVANRRFCFVAPAEPTALEPNLEGQRRLPFHATGQRGRLVQGTNTIVLLCFNEHERAALLKAFAPDNPAPPVIGPANCQVDDLGTLSDRYRLLLHYSRQANAEAQRSVSLLLKHHSPRAILAVGIAFGIDDQRQALSDVLVSEYLCPYDIARASASSTTLRGPRPPASRRLLDPLRQLNSRRASTHVAWPTLHFGGLLTGNQLIDNRALRDELRQRAGTDDIVGGEMEGLGLHTALIDSGVDWLVIKAICDWADGHKGKDKTKRQQAAAANAAEVARALLCEAPPLFDEPPQPLEPAPRPESPCELEAKLSEFGARHHPHAAGQRGKLASLHSDLAAPAAADSPSLVAMDDLLAWLRDDQQPPNYALLGQYGMGKTTHCQQLYQTVRAARTRGEKLPLPLYFDLRKVTRLPSSASGDVPTLQEVIEDCLRHGYLSADGRAPQYEDVLRSIDSERGALVIFDGLDEVLSRIDLRQGHAFVAQLLRVGPEHQLRRSSTPPPKLLLSCRTQFFRSLREQRDGLTGGHRGAEDAQRFRALELEPFDEPQIRAYLSALFPDQNPDQLIRQLEGIHNLKELAGRPFTLKLLGDFLPQLEAHRAAGRTVTGATLYREVARSWLARDQEKQHFPPEIKERIAADLAAHLSHIRQRGLPASELEAWLSRWLAQPEHAHADFQRLSRPLLQHDLRNATFLRRVEAEGESRFEFAHSSLQEFFLASHLHQALRQQQRSAWALPLPSTETLDFLGQLLLEEPAPKPSLAVLSSWRLAYQAQSSELLLAYAQRAFVQGWPQPVLQGIDLRGAQLNDWHLGVQDEEAPLASTRPLSLQGAQLQGAQLRRTRFWQVDLSGAQLAGACATQSDWVHARLDGVDWQDCDLAGAQWRPARQRCADAPALALRLRNPAFEGSALAFTPDGLGLVAADRLGTLRLIRASDGQELRRFEGHGDWVWACAFDPSGRLLASGAQDGTLRLWDTTSGQELRRFEGHRGGVHACAFDPSGQRLVSSGRDGTLRLWDAASGQELRRFEGHRGGVHACAFDPSGQRLVSSGGDGTLRLWDAASGQELRRFEGHRGPVTACAFDPSGQHLVSGREDGTLRLWDATSGQELRRLEGHDGWVSACAFDPSGQHLVSGGEDGTLRLWDATSGQELRRLEGHRGWVWACAFDPSGQHLASSGGDGTLRLWDAASGQELRRLEGHRGGVHACAFDPSGRRLASSGSDGTLRLWDAASGQELRRFEGHRGGVHACAFDPSGQRLVSSGGDGTLRLWDAASGQELRRFEGHDGWVFACAFDPSGQQLASSGRDGTLRLWDATSGQELRRFEGHDGWVRACAFDPCGQHLVSSGKDGTLRLWDVASGQELRRFDGHDGSVTACAFDPSGQRLVSSGSDGTLRLWDAASGQELRRFEGHDGWVSACAFDPSGQRLVSSGRRGTLILWDVASGQALRRFEGLGGWVLDCAFDPSGRHLVSAGEDGTLRLWDAASGQALLGLLHAQQAAAAWTEHPRKLLCAKGRAGRYLAWEDPGDGLTAPRLWPLDAHPEVQLLPWYESTPPG